jgi:nitrate/nitrite transporter NarK
MTSALARLIFYGAVMAGFALGFYYAGGNVAVSLAQAILLPLAGLSGTIQTISILVLKKVEEIESSADLGYYPRQRLASRLEERRTLSLCRMLVGIAAALITAGSVGLLQVVHDDGIKLLVLGASVGSACISIGMLFLTVYEVHVLSNLQAELRRQSVAQEKKNEALSSLQEDLDASHKERKG